MYGIKTLFMQTRFAMYGKETLFISLRREPGAFFYKFPHTLSVEAETHIHFRPKSAETFDLLSFSRHQGNHLCMR